jgi:hypothetical protein
LWRGGLFNIKNDTKTYSPTNLIAQEPTDCDISERNIKDSIFASDTNTKLALGWDSEMEDGRGGVGLST